jgi:hypothetical protein
VYYGTRNVLLQEVGWVVGVGLELTRLGLGVSQGKSVIVLHHGCTVIKYYKISKIGLNCSKRCSLSIVMYCFVISFKHAIL